PALTAGVVATAEELDGVGDDVDGRALGALLGLPLAPLQPAVDRDAAALGQVAGAVLALRAPDGHVEVVGLVDPLTAGVLAARVGRDAQLAHGRAAGQGANLGVGREVPGENHTVDVGASHGVAPFTKSFGYERV